MIRRISYVALVIALAAAQAHAASTVGDFDGDGRDELLLRNADGGAWMHYDVDGNGAVGHELALEMPDSVRFMGVGDFDGDGAAEIRTRDAGDRGWRYFDGTDDGFAELLVRGKPAEAHWTSAGASRATWWSSTATSRSRGSSAGARSPSTAGR